MQFPRSLVANVCRYGLVHCCLFLSKDRLKFATSVQTGRHTPATGTEADISPPWIAVTNARSFIFLSHKCSWREGNLTYISLNVTSLNPNQSSHVFYVYNRIILYTNIHIKIHISFVSSHSISLQTANSSSTKLYSNQYGPTEYNSGEPHPRPTQKYSTLLVEGSAHYNWRTKVCFPNFRETLFFYGSSAFRRALAVTETILAIKLGIMNL
jgi:hypothetical protein